MYLFIFESLGTSELILIGIVALIVLGPRRLPEIARKAGKIMSELRGTANEFKQTWEKEVDFEEEAKALKIDDLLDEADEDKPVPRENSILSDKAGSVEVPAIKAMNKEEFDAMAAAATEPANDNGNHEKADEHQQEEEPDLLSDKRNWL